MIVDGEDKDALTREQLDELVESLRGTCMNTIDGMMSELFNLTEDDLSADEMSHIEMEIFICGECGWWCEISQESEIDKGDGERYCTECIGDEEE